MPLSNLIDDIRQEVDKTSRKSKLADEYARNAEVRFALDHLVAQAVSNILNRKLEGPNPKQRTDADKAREKPFRLLSDKEIDAYSCEKTIRDGFAHSPIPSVPFSTLDAYPRMRFFETIFPREDVGVDMLRLTPLQQVHKTYMKKVYDGQMEWNELRALVQQHKDLKHLSNAFNVEHRLEAFIRNEAATDFLKDVYGQIAELAADVDAEQYRFVRRCTPGKSGLIDDPEEAGAVQLKAFAAHKITKEEDLLLGSMNLDKRLTKKLADLLVVYQFLIQALTFEQENDGDGGVLPNWVDRFRTEIDQVIDKLVEYGGERHTMTERGKMRAKLLDWLDHHEQFAQGLLPHYKAQAEALSEGSRAGAAPAAGDLWAF